MITQFDSVDVSTIPDNPEAVAGYVAGHWPNFNELVSRFPRAHHLSIAVQANERARCLDVEPGDAANAQAPGWFRNFADRSSGKPVLYTMASNGQALVDEMSRAGIARDEYFLWLAHFTGHPHICGPGDGYAQADGTQWTDQAMGRNLDQSLMQDYVFITAPAPNQHPKGIANFEGTFDTQTFQWTIRGTVGNFEAGTDGKKAAAYITFDENRGGWAIKPEPFADTQFADDLELGAAPKGPTGVARYAGSFNADTGQWTIHGVPGNFRPGEGGIAAAYITFDMKTGAWTIAGRPWASKPAVRKSLLKRIFGL